MKDIHIHLMPPIDSVDPQEEFLKKAKEANIDGGTIISLPPASFRTDTDRLQHWQDRLEYILEYTRQTPGFYPFFWIDPTENDAEKQIASAVESGIHGFKCICNHFMPKTQLKKFSAIAETGRPLQFHSGILFDNHDSGEYNRPLAFECLINVKGLKFSLAHLGWPWCDEFIALFGKIQATQHNVLDDQKVRMYIDLTPGVTYISRREVLRKLYLAGYGLEDRVLWGSDNSINNYNTAKVKSYLEFDRAVISDVIVESRENEYFRKIASDAFEKATEKNVNAFYGSE